MGSFVPPALSQRERERREERERPLLRLSDPFAAMAGCSEKEPIALARPDDLQQFMPPAYTAVAVKPAATSRLLKTGIVVLIAGAILLLFGAIGTFYFWNNNDNHVYNIHYSMSINGKVEEGSMEIDGTNNIERFRTGSGNGEAVEVHDFQVGITGVRFAGGEKCYIKTQVKAHLPDVKTLNKDSLLFDLEDEVMPAKFEEQSRIWVAADMPLSDPAFLSAKIRDLCGDLPIFWLRPTYTNSGQRKRRVAPHQRRQAPGAEEEVDPEAEFNPENPYHRGLDGDEGTMTFDPMLDHQGVCCTECRRSHTQCQRICEPLGGFQPWPYHYRGCRVACRVIMPCHWWVGRILGIL
ncbi:leukocyte cell-derived chemotaxin 1 [Salmo trutta]|uniref:Leukocyte cell-derived chemotaxin 1 n=1 Tax=Salmo trutta TaxID=8032 RepID=A0A673XUH7_SALTR|nr:leukocyte cell-derived chemotaxin 1-like [Salmo trutta]